jgi:hypothetical protein
MSDDVAAPNLSDQIYTAKPYAPLVGFLEVPAADLDNKTQTLLEDMWSYLGEESKSDSIAERLHALRVLETRLGSPRIGQSRLYKIASYINAQKAVKRAEEMRDAHLKEIPDGS